jgi:hypothetical protein
MFSKFKNFFKAFEGKFFHLLFIIFIGILCKITIFLPCLVYDYPLIGGQVVFEDLKGTQMIADIVGSQILTNIGSIPTASIDVGFQKVALMGKGISERCGGFIKLNDVMKFEGIFVPNPSAKECTNYRKTASNNCYFVGTKVQFWTALFLGGLFGLVIATAILQFIFLFL